MTIDHTHPAEKAHQSETVHEMLQRRTCRRTYACMDNPDVLSHDVECPGYLPPSLRPSQWPSESSSTPADPPESNDPVFWLGSDR